jgi:hypothetical protein
MQIDESMLESFIFTFSVIIVFWAPTIEHKSKLLRRSPFISISLCIKAVEQNSAFWGTVHQHLFLHQNEASSKKTKAPNKFSFDAFLKKKLGD